MNVSWLDEIYRGQGQAEGATFLWQSVAPDWAWSFLCGGQATWQAPGHLFLVPLPSSWPLWARVLSSPLTMSNHKCHLA
jgi:hypothetical protein